MAWKDAIQSRSSANAFRRPPAHASRRRRFKHSLWEKSVLFRPMGSAETTIAHANRTGPC